MRRDGSGRGSRKHIRGAAAEGGSRKGSSAARLGGSPEGSGLAWPRAQGGSGGAAWDPWLCVARPSAGGGRARVPATHLPAQAESSRWLQACGALRMLREMAIRETAC